MLDPGKILLRHPVTLAEFWKFQIPYWNDVKEIAVKAQKVFHHMKSIGWDIAITHKGPIIIEGNQNWGTASMQAANGGLLTAKTRSLFEQHGIYFNNKQNIAISYE